MILGDHNQLWNQSNDTKDNRIRMTSFCESNNLYIQNTRFQKTNHKNKAHTATQIPKEVHLGPVQDTLKATTS